MKRKSSFALIGGAQPFFFALGMYLVALFFSIYLFSALFNALNPKPSSSKQAIDPVPKSTVARSKSSNS